MARRPRRTPTRVLPPPAEGPAAPLPYVVPLMAALGLLVLVASTVPAVSSQQRLERDRERLQGEAEALESRLDGLRRELRDGRARRYLHIKATRTLLHRGAAYLRTRDQRLESR